MPLYDFTCVKCGRTEEKLFKSFDAMMKDLDWQCCDVRAIGEAPCNGFLQHQQSAPASIVVHGFSHINGYSSPRTISQRRGSVKTTVSGNFEAFSDGLVK